MGGKRTWKGKFIYLCAAGLIFFIVSGCATSQKGGIWGEEVRWEQGQEPSVPAQVSQPAEELEKRKFPSELKKEPENRPGPGETKPEPKDDAREGLKRAQRLFGHRDYLAALKENQRVLSLYKRDWPGDQALFNMGLIYAHMENPHRDFNRSLFFFQKMMKDFPQSPLANEARVWAGVLQENLKLGDLIEKFKQVDIAVEEKKREQGR